MFKETTYLCDLSSLLSEPITTVLSKFLTDLLDSIIPTAHCKKESFTFCEEIKKVSAINRFLISYDVCSLFTSLTLRKELILLLI